MLQGVGDELVQNKAAGDGGIDRDDDRLNVQSEPDLVALLCAVASQKKIGQFRNIFGKVDVGKIANCLKTFLVG